MGLFRPLPRPDSLEDVFLERYGDLLRAALAITGGRREAEDLVHDTFVRLMLARPDLASIEHLDAYLRTVLRNLHTARLRRLAHRAETQLSIVEFDSAHFAARALTPSQWTQARHDVAAACRYACTRRLTSKTGSLFLLRFVHELVPSDIARVTRLTRATVDITLGRGRAEVKTYLEDPARALQALGAELVPMSMPDVEPGADDDHDYLARVREAVFTLRHARCVEADHLRRLYASANDKAIPTQILAEIVTCPRCLDHVTRLTRTPPRAELPRDADPPSHGTQASEGPHASPGSPPPPVRLTPRDAGHARRAAAEQDCRAVRAHRPHLLRVFVNGFEIATHEISGGAARVTQTVSAMEPVWLVEVFSEQDVCLASLDVGPLPEAPAEQRVAVALADDRRIELAMSFLRQWPTLHLAYEDPAYAGLPTQMPAPMAIGAEMLDAEGEERLDSRATARGVPPSRRVPRSWQAWIRWALPESSESPGLRPSRLAWWTVSMAVIVWLLFFTPGTTVSAAERLWRAIAALVGRESVPAPMPRSGPARQRDITLPEPPKPRGPISSSPPASSALTPGVLAELEVDALTTLHMRRALTGQRIQVTRTPTGVSVEGLVEGQDRDRQALVRALRDVPHGAALRVNLSTPADLIGARAANAAATPPMSGLRAVTLGRDAIPAADDLRRAAASRAGGAVANVETEMHRIANEGLRSARNAFLEAATLTMLIDRFEGARASGMTDTASAKWRTLLTDQAERVARSVGRLRALLEPVFLSQEERASGPSPAPSAADQGRAGDEARRIGEDLKHVEHATRAALAVAETPPDTIELREHAFWRRLAATSDRIAALTRQLTSAAGESVH